MLLWRRLLLVMLGVLLLLVGLVLTWEGGVLWGKHVDAVEDWTEEVSHLSLEVADSLSAGLTAVDAEVDLHLLPLAQAVILGHADTAKVLAGFRTSTERQEQIRVVALFDAGGALITSSDPALRRRGVSAEDRDYFQLMRLNGAANFTTASHISDPVVDGGSARLYILAIRGLRDADGLFAGILAVAIDPEVLLRSQLDAQVLKHSKIRLFQDNGMLITIPPAGLSAVGTRYANSALFKLVETGLPRIGVLPNPFDGTPEIAALRKVGSSRILVSVKEPGGPELVLWWRAVTVCLAGAGVMFVMGGWLVARGVGIPEWLIGAPSS